MKALKYVILIFLCMPLVAMQQDLLEKLQELKKVVNKSEYYYFIGPHGAAYPDTPPAYLAKIEDAVCEGKAIKDLLWTTKLSSYPFIINVAKDNERFAILQFMLENGGDANAQGELCDEGKPTKITLLGEAIKADALKNAELALQHKARPTLPFKLPIRSGQISPKVQLLLDYGAQLGDICQDCSDL